MRHVTVRQLQVFAEAAKTLSFIRVAEKLNLSPAAVSFQIKQLESMSGFALFERMGKKARLTEAGVTLLGYANQVLQALNDADQSLSALKGLAGGRVTVGIVSTAKYLAPHLLARFQASFPAVALHLTDGNRRQILDLLVKGEVDIAIMGEPPPDAPVAGTAFAPHPTVLIAPPSHPLVGRGPLPPAAIKGENFVVREEGSGTRALTDRFFDMSGFAPRIAMVSSSNETIKQAVIAGMGLALISAHTIGLEEALGLVAVIPVEGLPVMRSWYVVHRRNMRLLPVHARLEGFLIDSGQSMIDDLKRSYREMATRRSAPCSFVSGAAGV